MNKKNIVVVLGGILALVGLVLPKSGSFVLLKPACEVACLVCCVIFLLFRAIEEKQVKVIRMSRFIETIIAGLIVVWFGRGFLLDLINGPQESYMTDVSGYYSVNTAVIPFGNNYYISGTNNKGERITVKGSSQELSVVNENDTALFIYYPNTKYLIRVELNN